MAVSLHILEGCRKQDTTCQEILYKQYYGMLLTIGLRYYSDINDAKLLVNEAYFKIFTKINTYNEQIAFEAWITRIMVNTCIDQWRKEKKVRKNEMSVPEYYDNESAHIDYFFEEKVEANYLRLIMQKVPEVSRKVFMLFAVEGFSHREIAETLNMNEGTSKWHVNNARKILKELVTKHNSEKKIVVNN